jgi:gliotoxin/aspirochlorine biosynthesis aminotransferase
MLTFLLAGFETCFVLRTQVHQVHVYPPASSTPEALVAQYETALKQAGCHIKAILFCNPHNPKGTIYPQTHIAALLQFCEKNNLHFISDEIYALSVFSSSGIEFSSVLQADLDRLEVNPNRVHMMYSVSKDLGSSGFRTVSVLYDDPRFCVIGTDYNRRDFS